MEVQAVVNALQSSYTNLRLEVFSFVPSLIGAVATFCIGLALAAFLGALVEKIVGAFRVDNMLRRLGMEEYMKRANLELNAGHFLGQVVYWFTALVFILATADILGFDKFSGFILDILKYLPTLFIGVLIVFASLVIANIVKHLVKASVMGARLHAGRFLSSAAWWTIVIFGTLVALVQLGIAVSIIETVITGLIGMIAIAGGLAFGLGGKEYASDILRELRDDLRRE